MALGDTNCAVEIAWAIRFCGRRKHGRISLISQWIVDSHVVALSAEKEVYVSLLCSLIYYFFKMTGCRGLGRVVWVLRLMSEFLSARSVWALVWVLLLCWNSPRLCPSGVCTAPAAFGSPGAVLDAA